MQKEKIFNKLYHGNINPVAKSVVQGSAYQKAMYQNSNHSFTTIALEK